MPEYLSPGVYVEEIDAGPKPIEGVSTSTAAAVGVTARGPNAGAPRLVTSFNEFVRLFGGYLEEPEPALRNTWGLAADRGQWWTFAHAVKGFFDNGGQRLFVKRVVASNATPSANTLGRGLVVNVVRDATATQTSVFVDGLYGVAVGTNVTIRGTAIAVTGYDSSRKRIDFGGPIGVDLRAGVDRIQVVPPVSTAGTDDTLRFAASSPGGWGESLSVRVRPMDGGSYAVLPDTDPAVAGVPAVTTLTLPSDPTGLDITVGDATGFAIGDLATVGNDTYTLANVAAGPPAVLTLDRNPPTLGAGTSVRRLRPAYDFAAAPSMTLRAWNAGALYPGALVEIDNGSAKAISVVDSVAGDVVTFHTGIGIDVHEGQRIRVIEARVEARYRPGGTTEAEELFENLRLIDHEENPAYLPRLINARSSLIRAEAVDLTPNPSNFPLPDATADLASFPSTPDGSWIALTGGDDAYASLTVDDFVGVDGGAGQRTGIQALEEIDEISICAVPGLWSPVVHDALIVHCETLRDRFAILDAQNGLDIQGVRTAREALSSSYAALYYPWVEVRDPNLRRNVVAPPSGHLAGIYARTDVERGVFKSPANEQIRGITAIAEHVTKREQDLLNPRGINALRAFPGRGNLVWGARTIASDPSWRYISVRRLFLFVEESIDEGTQWVVFEPNDEKLWARVRQTIINFLTTVWRSGALFGSTAGEAFFVQCDRSVMTQDDIDNGRLICLIGIAPVKPAEFVIFRIQQKTIEAQS